MKVYVDELPKSCAKCDRFCLDEKGRFRCILNSMPDYRSQEEKENNRRNDCPLQSLADHDKQVRKEVCEWIQAEFEDKAKYSTYFDESGYEINLTEELFLEILEKAQGETK